MSTLSDIWDSILGGIKHLFTGMLKAFSGGEPDDIMEAAGGLIMEGAEAALILIATGGGIKNVGTFLIELKSIHDQVQVGGGTGDQKYNTAAAAIKILWKQFGGDVDYNGLTTIIDIFTSLFHAKTKVAELGLSTKD